MQWVFVAAAGLFLGAGTVLELMSHGNEAIGAGAMCAGAALAGIFCHLRAKNVDHKGDGHDA